MSNLSNDLNNYNAKPLIAPLVPDGTNYLEWSVQMLMLLGSNGLKKNVTSAAAVNNSDPEKAEKATNQTMLLITSYLAPVLDST